MMLNPKMLVRYTVVFFWLVIIPNAFLFEGHSWLHESWWETGDDLPVRKPKGRDISFPRHTGMER